MAAKTLTIDGKQVSADESATILDAAIDAGISIPTLWRKLRKHHLHAARAINEK